jgi:alcohol dehydrogenase (cytochrome c)
VLFDGEIDGKPRKLLGQAARNGYFFVLDRTNGKNVVSRPFIDENWSKGVDAKGQPIPNSAKEPKTDGALLSIPAGGGTNWYPPSFNPEMGLFYVNATRGYSLAYLTDTDPEPEGYGGSGENLWSQHVLEALDYKTGKPKWQHAYESKGYGGSPGILNTAGKLLFTGDPSGNLIAFDPAAGKILWHFRMGPALTNGPMTYVLDGQQYVVAGAGEMLYAFGLVPGAH